VEIITRSLPLTLGVTLKRGCQMLRNYLEYAIRPDNRPSRLTATKGIGEVQRRVFEEEVSG